MNGGSERTKFDPVSPGRTSPGLLAGGQDGHVRPQHCNVLQKEVSAARRAKCESLWRPRAYQKHRQPGASPSCQPWLAGKQRRLRGSHVRDWQAPFSRPVHQSSNPELGNAFRDRISYCSEIAADLTGLRLRVVLQTTVATYAVSPSKTLK